MGFSVGGMLALSAADKLLTGNNLQKAAWCDSDQNQHHFQATMVECPSVGDQDPFALFTCLQVCMCWGRVVLAKPHRGMYSLIFFALCSKVKQAPMDVNGNVDDAGTCRLRNLLGKPSQLNTCMKHCRPTCSKEGVKFVMFKTIKTCLNRLIYCGLLPLQGFVSVHSPDCLRTTFEAMNKWRLCARLLTVL